MNFVVPANTIDSNCAVKQKTNFKFAQKATCRPPFRLWHIRPNRILFFYLSFLIRKKWVVSNKIKENVKKSFLIRKIFFNIAPSKKRQHMKNSLLSTSVALLFVGLILFSGRSFCQSETAVDKRLYDIYETSHIENLKANNPNLLKYYTYFLDNSYYILELSVGKEDAYPTIYNVKAAEVKGLPSPGNFNEDLSAIGTKNFNPLKYEFIRDKSRRKGYKIGKQNRAIVFYSEDEFAKRFTSATSNTAK